MLHVTMKHVSCNVPYTCGLGVIHQYCRLQEFSKHDEQPSKYRKSYTGHNPKTGQDFTCDVAYERFLGPELFFNPEIYSSDYTTPLPEVSAC